MNKRKCPPFARPARHPSGSKSATLAMRQDRVNKVEDNGYRAAARCAGGGCKASVSAITLWRRAFASPTSVDFKRAEAEGIRVSEGGREGSGRRRKSWL